MDIEASRQAVSSLPITVQVLTSLRESARLSSTHYSTQIEGNRLPQEQVEDVLHGGTFPNRERDEREFRNCYLTLHYLDSLIKTAIPKIAENDIKTLHRLVMEGRESPTPYRDGQNVIRGSGNGRTARLLTNLVLLKSGYGLKGIYSLEEYYARDLQSYYQALDIGESHNYYFGRAHAELTSWITCFCKGMADSFANVRVKAAEAASNEVKDQSLLQRELDRRQKQVLSLFATSRYCPLMAILNQINL